MAALLGAASAAAADPLRAGVYEGLTLAVAPNGTISGHFSEELGSEPVRQCSFFLAGKAGAIRAWSPGDAPLAGLRGAVQLRGQTVTLTLPGLRDLPGCASVLPPEAERGLELEQVRPGDWIGLAVVNRAQARLFLAATGARSRGYVVRDDIVAISQRSGRRVRVSYFTAEGRELKAWMEAADIRDPAGTP